MNKEMKNFKRYTDKDWEQLASLLSGEETGQSEKFIGFSDDNYNNTVKQWKESGKMSNEREIDVDKAWNKTYSRIKENGLLIKITSFDSRYRIGTTIKIAAMALIVIGLGSTLFYLNETGAFSKKTVITADNNRRNVEVSLSDGSKVFLNRNSELSYRSNPAKTVRTVSLKGEAFFEITPDASNPFVIDAGTAKVKVLGTSFNVITSNPDNAVEVFVKTGNVMLSDTSGKNNLELEPGYIGIMNLKSPEKILNRNQNYLSWKTDTLTYDGQNLEVVFHDLKRVHNIDILTDDPEILNKTITTTFYSQPQDTIIRVICTTFTLNYSKDGSGYHLSKR